MIVYVWDYVCMKGSWVAVVVGIKSDLSPYLLDRGTFFGRGYAQLKSKSPLIFSTHCDT